MSESIDTQAAALFVNATPCPQSRMTASQRALAVLLTGTLDRRKLDSTLASQARQ